jgi:hypothetical protein
VCQRAKCSCNCSSSIFVETGRLVRQGVPRSVPDLRVSLGGSSHKLGLTYFCAKIFTIIYIPESTFGESATEAVSI